MRCIVGVLASFVVVLGAACSTFSASNEPPDAGSDAPVSNDPGVYCQTGNGATAYCDPARELCCEDSMRTRCMPLADKAACTTGFMACDDLADCAHAAGTVCCGSLLSDNIHATNAECLPLNDCQKRSYWIVLCDPAATSACPGSAACVKPDGGQGDSYCARLRYF